MKRRVGCRPERRHAHRHGVVRASRCSRRPRASLVEIGETQPMPPSLRLWNGSGRLPTSSVPADLTGLRLPEHVVHRIRWCRLWCTGIPTSRRAGGNPAPRQAHARCSVFSISAIAGRNRARCSPRDRDRPAPCSMSSPASRRAPAGSEQLREDHRIADIATNSSSASKECSPRMRSATCARLHASRREFRVHSSPSDGNAGATAAVAVGSAQQP
jgi:hypothetical protein